MTFLGLEKASTYTPQAIFDPVAVKMEQDARDMYINALYNDYKLALQEEKDFNEKFGNFMSPISADMDWYDKNVTGAVRDYINQMYAAGIDPLRSSEGRAGVRRLISNMPYSGIAQIRQSAEAAKEYLKNRAILQSKGMWNPDFEKQILGGKSLEDWDTIGNGSVWTRTSPSEYQDLNQYTSHIFDNIKDSYIGTRGPYDYYGVTEKDLYQSLTPDRLGGLLNTDLGRFHYNNAINDLAAQGILNPTEAQKMEQFRKNIVAANHERVHEDRKINEIWKMQQEDASRMRAARASREQQQTQTNQYSIAEIIRRTSSTRIVGQQTQEYSGETLAKQRDAQIKKGLEISKATGGHSNTYKGRQMFKNVYQDNNYDAATLTDFVVNQGFQRAGDEINTVIIPRHQFHRLSNLAELQSRTVGFRGPKFNAHLSRALKNADEVRITFTGGNYGAYMKNATNQNHFSGIVKVRKYARDENGNKILYNAGPNKNTYKMDDVVYDDWYFDSHITSQPDDERAGSLGVVNKKGQVKETPNIPITNSQDTKYQDAVTADRYTTAPYVKGSDYKYDAIYTELTGYPYNP